MIGPLNFPIVPPCGLHNKRGTAEQRIKEGKQWVGHSNGERPHGRLSPGIPEARLDRLVQPNGHQIPDNQRDRHSDRWRAPTRLRSLRYCGVSQR